MKLARHIAPGKRFSLDDIPTNDRGPFADKKDPEVERQLQKDLTRLCELQELLYAEQRQRVLVIFQALDTAGKDGVLRHVVGPLDSRGVSVVSFKAPNADELAHDYLWRVHEHTPAAGRMVFFNRSHYEDVLVVRVLGLAPDRVWRKRYEHIRAFEQMLADEGTRIVKFYLHISREEQKKRLRERLEDPTKRWKWDPKDLDMRAKWAEFRAAYEDALRETSTDDAPWYVVPADRKWFRDLAVTRVLVELLEAMAPKAPTLDIDPAAITIPD